MNNAESKRIGKSIARVISTGGMLMVKNVDDMVHCAWKPAELAEAGQFMNVAGPSLADTLERLEHELGLKGYL